LLIIEAVVGSNRLKIVLVGRFLHQLVLYEDCRIDQEKISSFVLPAAARSKQRSSTWEAAA
jgi:hypothetical protein